MTTDYYSSESLEVYDALLRRIEGMPDHITRLTLSLDISHGARPFIDLERVETLDGQLMIVGGELVRQEERYFLFVDGEKVRAEKA